MKKIFVAVLLFSSFSLFALETSYPVIMNSGTILINAGIGFGKLGGPIEAQQKCPPLAASIDFALPFGGLPFTVGLIAGYFSEANKDIELNAFMIASRIAYHHNFNVPRLDTYAALTLGGIVANNNNINEGHFWPGFCIGSRYFFLPNMGAFAELGLDRVQIISFGLSFKL